MLNDLEQNEKIVQLTSELKKYQDEIEQERALRNELETKYEFLNNQYVEAIDYIKKQRRASSNKGSGCLFFVFILLILLVLIFFVMSSGASIPVN